MMPYKQSYELTSYVLNLFFFASHNQLFFNQFVKFSCHPYKLLETLE